jgi:glucokinase
MPETLAIGVDIGGTGTKGGLVSPDGTIHERHEVPTDPQAGTKSIIQVVDGLLERAGNRPVAAIGVGAAGFIDHAHGSVTFSPNLVYDDPNIADALTARTGLASVVDNDANVAAWGEHAFGSARDARHLVLVTLGTGVGSGIIVDGHLVRGATGSAAEFGHTVVDPFGPPCPCGLRGCLEQFTSGTAIARNAKAAVEADRSSTILSFAGSVPAITAEHVAHAAREMDEVARTVLAKAGRMLGIGLSNLANLFDPEVIVLAGSVVAAGEPYLGVARDTFNQMMMAQRRRAYRLDVTKLGHDAGILGAAALALYDLEER